MFTIPFAFLKRYFETVDLTWRANFYKCCDDKKEPSWGCWNPVKTERISIPVNDEKVIEVNRITIQKGAVSQVVLYWYQSHGRVIASEYMGKIYTVLDAMRTNRTDAALVRIISQVPENALLKATAEEAAEKQVVEFTQTLFPLLADFLPE
jgi:EpsI family protein